MIGLVGLLMICLLKAHHTVQPAACQPLIVAGLHWHHLDGEVAEIWPCHLQHLLEIVHAVEPRELSRHHQQILKRAETPYSLALFLHLVERKGDARERIVVVKSAIYAFVGAGVAHIERYIHRNGLSEAFERIGVRQLRHLFDIWLCGRRYECHEVVHVKMLLGESRFHIRGRLGRDLGGSAVPVVFFQFVVKHRCRIISRTLRLSTAICASRRSWVRTWCRNGRRRGDSPHSSDGLSPGQATG